MLRQLFGSLAVAALSVLCLGYSTVHGETVVSANFGSYTDGPLVGQNGWQQYNTQITAPLTVSGGAVSWAGGSTVNNQDAFLAFPQQYNQPTVGDPTQILNFDILLSISSAPSVNPSYFAALNTFTTSTTTNNFQNARLVAQASGSGYVFGARVNGQGGYPFAFGTDVLDFGVDYALRAEIHMVSGNANDFINLYVGPDFNNLTLHATAVYGSGTVSDPSFGAMLISQFGSGTVGEPGVSIKSMSVSAVPEPTSAGLLALTGLAGLAFRRRRS
jgi:hypothetical protein